MKRGLSVGDLPSTVGHDVSENVTLTQATRRNSHRKAKKSRYTGEVNGDRLMVIMQALPSLEINILK